MCRCELTKAMIVQKQNSPFYSFNWLRAEKGMADLFNNVKICTCFIRDVTHVGGVMFNGFFIMFQRCVKVSVLICRIPKFFFLQGLLGNKTIDMII